nr:LOW QUALITY PROTEIN: uncharacterized protein LOC103233546 [Chlorocebus sabaeus]
MKTKLRAGRNHFTPVSDHGYKQPLVLEEPVSPESRAKNGLFSLVDLGCPLSLYDAETLFYIIESENSVLRWGSPAPPGGEDKGRAALPDGRTQPGVRPSSLIRHHCAEASLVRPKKQDSDCANILADGKAPLDITELKHQDIRTFWNLNMQGIGGEGTEEESSLGQAGGKLKMAAWPWMAEVGAAGARAERGGLKSESFHPSQEAKTPEAEISPRPRRARVQRIPLVSAHQSQRHSQRLLGVMAAAPLPTFRSCSLSSFCHLQPGTKQGKAAPAQLDPPADGDLCTWL